MDKQFNQKVVVILEGLLGFVASSNSYCRFCSADRSVTGDIDHDERCIVNEMVKLKEMVNG